MSHANGCALALKGGADVHRQLLWRVRCLFQHQLPSVQALSKLTALGDGGTDLCLSRYLATKRQTLAPILLGSRATISLPPAGCSVKQGLPGWPAALKM